MKQLKSLLMPILLLAPLTLPVAEAEELPPAIRSVEALGAKVMGRFDAPGGLKGYAARYNGQGLALYLTADGEHVLTGTLFDAAGKDLTRAPLDRLVYQPLGQEMWRKLQDSAWIADGDAKASRVLYVFSDPNCPYCHRFWQQARPWVEGGRVQLRHVVVGMLSPDSLGKAAALLAAGDPQAALGAHESAGRASTLKPLGEIPDEIADKLRANLELMAEMGASATPAIYYMDVKGRLQRQQGVPRAMEPVMGSPAP